MADYTQEHANKFGALFVAFRYLCVQQLHRILSDFIC